MAHSRLLKLAEQEQRDSSKMDGTQDRKAKSTRQSLRLSRQKDASHASSFVVPTGSQQVDLTLSSDGELEAEKDTTDDDAYEDPDPDLPRGPGWVQKRSLRRTSASNPQSATSQKQSTFKRRTTMMF